MDILTRIVNCAEELVHIAVDRHVLPSSTANNDGIRQREDDKQSFNPRPRHRHRGEQVIPIPCCKCTKWGEVFLEAAEKGMPLRSRKASLHLRLRGGL